MKKADAKGYRLFVSSVQKELAAERRAVKDFVTHDPLLGRFISDVFLFEFKTKRAYLLHLRLADPQGM